MCVFMHEGFDRLECRLCKTLVRGLLGVTAVTFWHKLPQIPFISALLMIGNELVWPWWLRDYLAETQHSPILLLELLEKNWQLYELMSYHDDWWLIYTDKPFTNNCKVAWWWFSTLSTVEKVLSAINSLLGRFFNYSVHKTICLSITLKTQEISCNFKNRLQFL